MMFAYVTCKFPTGKIQLVALRAYELRVLHSLRPSVRTVSAICYNFPGSSFLQLPNHR